MAVQIREVWAHNVDDEFTLIRSVVDDFPFISMDTEFPGVVYRHNDRENISPTQNYSILKQNVDALNIIQFGLTLADSRGNFPSLGSDKYTFIWQFNFKDFDLSRDSHAPDSVELLRVNGIDFDRNIEDGVDSWRFSELMMSSGLVCNEAVAWVTFHGAYDFGYLLKLLTQKPLPTELGGFTGLISVFFGGNVFDVKFMIRFCNGLFGGLDRVAKALKIDRTVGKSHQAGSDSLLTWLVFQRIRDGYFQHLGGIDQFAGSYFGLEHIGIFSANCEVKNWRVADTRFLARKRQVTVNHSIAFPMLVMMWTFLLNESMVAGKATGFHVDASQLDELLPEKGRRKLFMVWLSRGNQFIRKYQFNILRRYLDDSFCVNNGWEVINLVGQHVIDLKNHYKNGT